jgi:hypothetical protein
MERTLKISVERARELYKDSEGALKSLLEENFTKEELSGDDWRSLVDLYDVKIASGYFSRVSQRPPSNYLYPFNKLKLIFKAIRGDWEPDFNNHNEHKYRIYLSASNVLLTDLNTMTLVLPKSLYIQDEERAKHIIKYFSKELMDYFND